MGFFQYFRCAPDTLCSDAACCSRPYIQPALTIGDYLRLSCHTGEPVDQIWRTKGDMIIMHVKSAICTVSLGLLNAPCPYLKSLRCSAYEARPMTCAAFPALAYSSGHAHDLSEHFTCLKNEPKPKQLELAKDLEMLMAKEVSLDAAYLWNKSAPPSIYPNSTILRC